MGFNFVGDYARMESLATHEWNTIDDTYLRGRARRSALVYSDEVLITENKRDFAPEMTPKVCSLSEGFNKYVCKGVLGNFCSDVGTLSYARTLLLWPL